MVAVRPRDKHSDARRRTRVKTGKTRPIYEISYFFIGRQVGSPYAYDRNSSLRPSNVLWLVQDILDYKAHDYLYRQEVLGFAAKGRAGQSRRYESTGITSTKFGRGGADGINRVEGGGGGGGGGGEVIDLTVSDEDDKEGSRAIGESEETRPSLANKYRRGKWAEGDYQELRATFRRQVGRKTIDLVTG